MVTIDGYPIDGALSERMTYETEITENEVEKGAPVTDHMRPKVPVLEIEGIVSDTPIGKIALDPSRRTLDGNTLPSQDAFNRFTLLQANPRLIVVVCSYGKLERMGMELFSPVKDFKTTKALKFTMKLRQVNIIENLRTTVKTAVPNGQGKQNLGSREALNKFLGKNLVYVLSKPREPDNFTLQVDANGRFNGASSPHKPIKDPQFGMPVVSTTHFERQTGNGFDTFGKVWVDHYKLVTGDQGDDPMRLLADGYVVLQNTGPKPTAGVRANIERGYYFLNAGRPNKGVPNNQGVTSVPLDANGNPIKPLPPGVTNIPITPSQTKPVPGTGDLVDSQGNSITKRPPGPGGWPSVLGNNQ